MFFLLPGFAELLLGTILSPARQGYGFYYTLRADKSMLINKF